jgi:hypothetical protein
MSSPVKLADGTTVNVAHGSVLPKNLHPDFEYYAIAAESIPDVKGELILVQTSIAQRDRNVAHTRNQTLAESLHVIESAKRSIRNAMPKHNKVHASMMRGERRGIRGWQNLIDDINIVLSQQLVDGGTHKVMLERPEVTKEDGWVTVSAPVFLMRL